MDKESEANAEAEAEARVRRIRPDEIRDCGEEKERRKKKKKKMKKKQPTEKGRLLETSFGRLHIDLGIASSFICPVRWYSLRVPIHYDLVDWYNRTF